MGCLNSTGGFSHWFGNVHLSGPCNRSCYFCIGQHMMELDKENTLDKFPLPGLEDFIKECYKRKVQEINITGTNTDPTLYKHHETLTSWIRRRLPEVKLGIRTNAVSPNTKEIFSLYDKASVSVTSLDPVIYKATMGQGEPPDVERLLYCGIPVKFNIVLGPENSGVDLMRTIIKLREAGAKAINLREPYGQPHIGDPFEKVLLKVDELYGMPQYDFHDTIITYWNVHYVEVESVNLYANGKVSVDYPITRGHSESGQVIPQNEWKSGRHVQQWVT